MLFTLLAFLVALGILITFHELGHYFVARLCGVRVLRFSVGFGRVVLRRFDRHGTEWALSALPLGGYVKMQDDPPAGATPAQIAQSFNAQPVGRRFAIVAAGPIFNLVLAVFFYAALNLAGTEEPAPILAQPAQHTAAAEGGFARGDRILAIDGRPVVSWSDVRWQLLDLVSRAGRVQITVQTAADRRVDRTVALVDNAMDPSQRDPLAEAGFTLNPPKPIVRGVIAGGAGERAGLRAGDRITSIGSQAGLDTGETVAAIRGYPEKTVVLGIVRDGAALSIPVTPDVFDESGKQVGRLGVQLGGDLPMVSVRYGIFESVWRGTLRTGETAWFSLRMMGRMLTGDVSWRNISGPVTIADYAGQTARIGLAAYIAYMALISISLGVLNLLPIPMLDGGHLLYYLIEIVRGKPPSERWLDLGQRAGLGLLATLMVLALFNDLTRLFT